MNIFEKTNLFAHLKVFFLFNCNLQCLRNGTPKFQPIMVNSFEVMALDNRKSKEIKLKGHLTFTVITSICSTPQCWDLA